MAVQRPAARCAQVCTTVILHCAGGLRTLPGTQRAAAWYSHCPFSVWQTLPLKPNRASCAGRTEKLPVLWATAEQHGGTWPHCALCRQDRDPACRSEVSAGTMHSRQSMYDSLSRGESADGMRHTWWAPAQLLPHAFHHLTVGRHINDPAHQLGLSPLLWAHASAACHAGEGSAHCLA